MKVTLKVWRQQDSSSKGYFETYNMNDVDPGMSLLELLDVLNDQILCDGRSKVEPIAFDSDCREGICGMCSMVINGRPHGPSSGTTTCQIYMRNFKNDETIYVEPFRADTFPVIKDLSTDRSSFDTIIQSGGYISAKIGGAQDANSMLISKEISDTAMDAAQCIGCGACVAACKNSSAMLFVSAKVAHLSLLPQGQPERQKRVLSMVNKMDELGFGNCTNEGECEAECPKSISIANITHLNREYISASFKFKKI